MPEESKSAKPEGARPQGPRPGGNRSGRGQRGGGGQGGGRNKSGRGGRGRLRREGPRPHQTPPVREVRETATNPDEKPIPPLEPGNIRIIPLGGVEEIGRNMTMVEIGDDIVIVDCGFQFKE